MTPADHLLLIDVLNKIEPHLAGLRPELQAAIIADLHATHLMGWQGEDADTMRELLIKRHVEAVRAFLKLGPPPGNA